VREAHLIAIIVAAMATIAHADLVSDPWAQAGVGHESMAQASCAERQIVPVSQHSHYAMWLGADLPAAFALPDLPSPSPESRAQIRELPPAPGSAALCLWALGGLGMWHLGRSARKIHLGTMPEWYHTGGPTQVGHVTPLDLEFNSSAMPICRFEAPVAAGDDQLPPWWQQLEPRERLRSQYFPLIADPRGPPVHS
jgi:hypothetical protein